MAEEMEEYNEWFADINELVGCPRDGGGAVVNVEHYVKQKTEKKPIVPLKTYIGSDVVSSYITHEKYIEYKNAIENEGLSDCIDKMRKDKPGGLDVLLNRFQIECFDEDEALEELTEKGIKIDFDDEGFVDGVPNYLREMLCEYYNMKEEEDDEDYIIDDMYYKGDVLYYTLK